MTPNIRRLATRLLALSLDEQGRLDASRVAAVIEAAGAQATPAAAAELLCGYQMAIARWQHDHTAHVTSATVMTAAQQAQVRTAVSQAHPGTQDYTWTVDETLLGGITVQVGDVWQDASVRTALKTVKEALHA